MRFEALVLLLQLSVESQASALTSVQLKMRDVSFQCSDEMFLLMSDIFRKLKMNTHL